MSLNTAAIIVDSAAGRARPLIENGARQLRALVWFRDLDRRSQSWESSPLSLAVANLDAVALVLTPPRRTAVDGNGRLWHRGRGVDGAGSFTVRPIMYTPGRRLVSVTVGIGRCTATVTRSAEPFTVTFGGDGANAQLNCEGVTGSQDAADGFRAEDFPQLLGSLDNTSAPGPVARYVYDPGLGPHSWAGPRLNLWRGVSSALTALRLDYGGLVIPR